MNKPQCVICGDTLYGDPKYQKYCSVDCSEKAYFSTYKEHGKEVNEKDRYIIFERDKFTCIYCGKSSFADNSELHIDHVYPLSQGGQNIASNLVTSCKWCNITKNATVLNEDNLHNILQEIEARNQEAEIKPYQRIRTKRAYETTPL